MCGPPPRYLRTLRRPPRFPFVVSSLLPSLLAILPPFVLPSSLGLVGAALLAGLRPPDATIAAAVRLVFGADLRIHHDDDDLASDPVMAHYGKWRHLREHDPPWLALLEAEANDTLALFGYPPGAQPRR